MSDMASSRGSYRLEYRCTLRFEGALSVASGEQLSVLTDSPILRDGHGKPYLPGASVRGVIRDWCEREAPLLGIPAEHLDRLFGATPDDRGRGDDRQGRLTVPDVKLELPETGRKTEVRDHVRIRPDYGVADTRGKFDRELAHDPRGTLRLLYQGDRHDDREIGLLASAVEALEQGGLAFGGRTGVGLGWATVADPQWHELDRRETTGLAHYLHARLSGDSSQIGDTIAAPRLDPAPARALDPAAPPWSLLRLPLVLRFDGPMLIAGPGRSRDHRADAVYLTKPDGENEAPILPGSSLRGVLRAHAGRIARTIGWSDSADVLFGKAEGDSGQRGLLRVRDGVIPAGNEVHEIRLEHVAIDRITGFAADGRLFDAVALASPVFATEIRVRWDSGDVEHLEALRLLLLTLRDARDGLLWVGSRTTRGYGHLESLEIGEAQLSFVDASGRHPRTIAGSLPDLAAAIGVDARPKEAA